MQTQGEIKAEREIGRWVQREGKEGGEKIWKGII